MLMSLLKACILTYHDNAFLQEQYNIVLNTSNCDNLACLRELSSSESETSMTATYYTAYAAGLGPSAQHLCQGATTQTALGRTPTYSFTQFNYNNTETVRTASPVPTFTSLPQCSLPYDRVQHLLPSFSTASWGDWDTLSLNTSSIDSKDPYGHFAYSKLWDAANIPSFTSRGICSTTVSPIPVSTDELILPPPLLFGPTDCYTVPRDFILGVAGSASQIEGAIADEGKAPVVPEIFAKLSP
ncbi:hypothetical protein ACHAQJ_006759 [Trichoderma viride]